MIFPSRVLSLFLVLSSILAFAPIVRPAPRTLSTLASTADFINTSIEANDVVVFSKSYCPFCTKTKSTLSSYAPALGLTAPPLIIELDERPDGANIQTTLQTMSGQRTVPNVYVKGVHVGGNDDFQKAVANGKVKEIIEGAKDL